MCSTRIVSSCRSNCENSDPQNGCSGPILLQKSKVADLRIFRENTKREAIADSYNLNRVTEVACESNVRRRGPSHLYTKAAPVARRIFDHQCRTTFATVSARSDISHRRKSVSLFVDHPGRARGAVMRPHH